MSLQEWKNWLGTATGMDDSALHALVGMMILMAVSALLRRVPWSWQSWLTLLVIEVANEAHDMLNPASGENRWGASLHDFWVTMLSPTLLLVMTPWIIRLAARRQARSTKVGD